MFRSVQNRGWSHATSGFAKDGEHRLAAMQGQHCVASFARSLHIWTHNGAERALLARSTTGSLQQVFSTLTPISMLALAKPNAYEFL
jgi:hypothetical protein